MAAQIAELSIVKISRAVVPYVAILFADVLLITYLPFLSTWLPGILAGE